MEATSGSNIRPRKMLDAFKDNGYEVDVVMGDGKARKEQIREIKQKIRCGKKYDFVYSESSTMPTLLTEKNHLPRYPILDFSFLKFCKKNNIHVGLFYRDIQWKFSIYKDNVPILKRMLSVPLYKYDLKQYEKILDVFYLPTSRMANYLIEHKKLLDKMQVLMPGCELNKSVLKQKDDYFMKRNKEKIEIFYVGGVSRIYDLRKFLQVVCENEVVSATICCRESEWIQSKKMYEEYLCERIKIVHTSGKGLEEYYQKSDICCAFAGTGEYMSMAMPVKVFEYLAHVTPIIATKNTVAGDFVRENKIGWTVEYDVKKLSQLLKKLIDNPDEIRGVHERQVDILKQNTWKNRAQKVIKDLS
ncbi:MAG: glycosyltransferase [Clostridiales bacterium]|nr:glycosyltransferase [Clostridiales bacterium]